MTKKAKCLVLAIAAAMRWNGTLDNSEKRIEDSKHMHTFGLLLEDLLSKKKKPTTCNSSGKNTLTGDAA